MKRSKLARLLATLALLLVLLAPLDPAYAGWKFGDTRYFTAEQVCRDGIIVLAGWDKVGSSLGDPVPGDTSTIPLGARLYTNTALPLSSAGIRSMEEFGPLLAPERTVLMTYHETPLVADITDNGSFIINFYVYARETWAWSRLLDVGQTVLLHENSIIHEAEVDDCFLHRPTAPLGGSAVISGQQLLLDPMIAPAAETTYRVETLPARGRLLLNGSPLAIGDTFTQADVNTGRLRYTNNGSSGDSDSFQFSVRSLTRASVASNGAQASGGSQNPDIAADGLTIAFDSSATNLAPGDTNTCGAFTAPGSCPDIFVRDTQLISTTRVSLSSAGAQADGPSYSPAISASGRDVAFESDATNLAGGPGTSSCDAVLDTNGVRDVFMRSGDLTRHLSIRQVSYGNCAETDAASGSAALGADPFVAAFDSAASNLQQGFVDSNGQRDAIRWFFGTTALMSVGSGPGATGGGSVDPAISGNGDYVAFASGATGGLIASDTNGISDIFVRDTNSSATVRVSVATNGAQATSTAQFCPIIGPCVALGSSSPDISPDARFVVFASYANNLVAGDSDTISDIFVRDRDTDVDGDFDEPGAVKTQIVSVASNGTQGDGNSLSPVISADGRFIAFASAATNLVLSDTNGQIDVFLHDRDSDGDGVFDEPGAIRTTRISVAADGTQAEGGASADPSISYDGAFIAFESSATNLVPGDTNGQSDVFVAYTGYRSTLLIEVTDARVALPLVVRPAP